MLWQYLLYCRDAKLGQLERRINPGKCQRKKEFMRRRAIYTWQDYRTNGDILSEFKINPVAKKIRNYRNKSLQHVRRLDRDRDT